jgi:maltose phosphorylase
MAKIADEYLQCDPWKIIEDGFHADRNLVSESVFSLGNEYMGVRGYAEEGGSIESLQGSYFNGIYEEAELNKSYKGIVTKSHFMVNAVDWLSAKICIDGENLDMGKSRIANFKRVLDMRAGTFVRSFDWTTESGLTVHVQFLRFLNMEKPQEAYQKISFSVMGKDSSVTVRLANNFNTVHGWAKKHFWKLRKKEWQNNSAAIQSATKTTGQQVFSGFVWKSSAAAVAESALDERADMELGVGIDITLPLKAGVESWIEKKIINIAEKQKHADDEPLWSRGLKELADAASFNLDDALAAQKKYWQKVWDEFDIRIDGDEKNQQGIRFCIFQMQQTYHGYDPANNIGAKGLTGEAYNGHAFWDSETYCLPYYLFSNLKAARNLLEFRYNTLQQAKERAAMLDCRGACYPVATLNGEEACDLWQHASLQFQPSTAVAYGIFHYTKISGDTDFLYTHGAEMLVEISRFLVSRGSWNREETGFGFYAVMGPDEFHMMVNNNCYTNLLAKKTFEYTEKVLLQMKEKSPKQFDEIIAKTKLNDSERKAFKVCAEKMIILYDDETKLFEQHEGYFGLPHIDVDKIPITDFPLYHNWSYDRIYRTDMIKQPDVLMFQFLYNQDFSREAKLKNYEFYEPNTIHESSLSPSIHSIFASELGKHAEAFNFFGFATRMDLDNYNRNTTEGLHTTSIAAAWVNIVYGFGGMRSDGETLVFNPSLPAEWQGYEFRIVYQGAKIRVTVTNDKVSFSLADSNGKKIPIMVYGEKLELDDKGLSISLPDGRKG